MARSTDDLAALIRVPLAECPAIPIFLRTSALAEWLAANGVDVKPDHAGRPSIDLPTAYRLQAEAEAGIKAEDARRRAAADKLAAQVDKAQQHRQDTYVKAYLAALPATSGSTHGLTEARQKAWRAVRAAERNLSPEVAQRLGPVSLDGLPGAPSFHMLGGTLLPPEDEPMEFRLNPTEGNR